MYVIWSPRSVQLRWTGHREVSELAHYAREYNTGVIRTPRCVKERWTGHQEVSEVVRCARAYNIHLKKSFAALASETWWEGEVGGAS